MPKVYVPLAIMVIYPALAGCGAGETLTDEMMMDGEEPLGTTSQALVRTNRTFVRNSTVINGDNTTRREHCRVENGQFELANVAVGADVFKQNTQVLLSDGNTLRGLCTVVDEADPGDSNFYMAKQSTTADGGFEARFGSSTPRTGVTVSNRWSTTAPLHAIAEPASTLADLTTSTLNKVMDFSDRARDTGTRSVLYAAPHPFEAGTFNQIQYIHDTLDYQSWDTVWALGVKNQSATADAAFHITANDISGLSFPQLGAFMGNKSTRLPYAVSFHSFNATNLTCNTYELKIGGGIEPEFRRGVGEIIKEYIGTPAVPSLTNVGYWEDGTCPFDGDEDDNFINRVTKQLDRGLQLEQRSDMLNPTSGSAGWRNDVAEATKSVYDCLLDSSDDSGSTASTSYVLSGTTTTYGTTGVACPRWIGDITLSTTESPADYTMTAGALLDSCEVGAHAHVDIYKDNGEGAWKRIGGGRVQYELVNGKCEPREKGWTGSGQLNEPSWSWRPSSDDLGSGTYRAVVRATRASGAPAKAFFQIINL